MDNPTEQKLVLAWDSLGAYIETADGVILEGPLALLPKAAEALRADYQARLNAKTLTLD